MHSFTANGAIVHNSIMESLATGVRTVVTKFSSPAEYAEGVADFIEPVDYEPIVATNCEWAVLRPQDVGDALGRVYLEGTTLQHYAPGVALGRSLDNKVIGAQWRRLLKELNLPEIATETVSSALKAPDEDIVDDYLKNLA